MWTKVKPNKFILTTWESYDSDNYKQILKELQDLLIKYPCLDSLKCETKLGDKHRELIK